MTKFHIIQNEQFAQLQELKRAATYTYQRKKISDYIYNDIEAVLGRKLRKAPKVAQVIRRIVYLASDRGYSFPGRETLANQLDVSTSTVDNAISLLKQSGDCDVFYRENPKSNSAKTCVFIFRRHSNYPEIKRILTKQYNEAWEEDFAQMSTESKADPIKKIATLLITKKQDLKRTKQYHSVSKIIEYLALKIEKVQQENSGSITALSSYIDKTIAQEIRKVKSQAQPAAQATGAIPIFNWLETS
ncbi:hypothetical protein PSE10B_55730 [Pseudomonas amygdali pv. eriobotryae]|nr:HTH domain-containing protein [Pseudomonas amygdali]GFZ69051.1 hypothetical protein PSE10B_55730 [Pseudomonas amygdali pv. eriobotryae]